MRYATITSWAKYFEEQEGVRISSNSIRRRLKGAETIGITARNSVGRVLKNSFYAESNIRLACADLLQDIPQANENGFFEQDDIKYGTIRAWSRVLPISQPTITSRLEQSKVKSIKGKDMSGKIRYFYSEPDILKACADLLADLPQTDEEGFFEKDSIQYGTIVAWSKVLPISKEAIISRLEQSQIKGIKGKDIGGNIRVFYAEPDISSTCANLLKPISQADKDGFFVVRDSDESSDSGREKDDIKYGTIFAWSKVLSTSGTTITSRLKKSQTKSIKGKDKNGHICTFYSESDIRSVYDDSIQEMPQTDKDGFFVVRDSDESSDSGREKDDIKYGTVYAWSKVLSISHMAIASRLKHFQENSIKGKNKMGCIRDFFSESDVRSACADHLQDMPQADEDGFFVVRDSDESSDSGREKDGIKYGTIQAWSRVLPISERAITSRLKHFQENSIKGKNKMGCIRDFFSESDVRSACADHLQDMPQADEDGFFVVRDSDESSGSGREKGGVKYGTIGAWSKVLPISEPSIASRLKNSKIKSVKGKVYGHIHDFYSEPDVRSACTDLLRKMPQVDEDGFFVVRDSDESSGSGREKDNIKYGTVYAWSKVLSIPEPSIISRLKHSQANSIKGKDRGGRVRDFYSEIDVRIACADILEKQKNNSSILRPPKL